MANKALVVGASGFSKKYIKKIIADYDFVIACDKGAEAFYGTDMEFDLCIGAVSYTHLRAHETTE